MDVKNLIIGAGVGLGTDAVFEPMMAGAELGAIGMIPVELVVGLGGSYMLAGGEGVIGAIVAVVIKGAIQSSKNKTRISALQQQTTAYNQFASECPSGSNWLTCVNQKMQAAGYPPVQSVNGVVAPPM